MSGSAGDVRVETRLRGGAVTLGDAVRYMDHLRSTVVATASPYGYTLTIWTSGAVLMHARGLPSTLDAVLYMVGAVVGYAVIGLIAFRGLTARSPSRLRVFSLWDAAHFLSIGTAIGAAALVAHLLQNRAAWPVDGALATAIYLVGTALQLTLTPVREPSP